MSPASGARASSRKRGATGGWPLFSANAEAGTPAVTTHAQPYTDDAERLRQCEAAGALLRREGAALETAERLVS